MSGHLYDILENVCNKYENDSKYHIKKFEEGGQTVGFCVSHDENEIRYLDEAHYIGQNKWVSVKMWKFLTKGAKTLRCLVQKTNVKMYEMYLRMGFKVIKSDEYNNLMERGD